MSNAINAIHKGQLANRFTATYRCLLGLYAVNRGKNIYIYIYYSLIKKDYHLCLCFLELKETENKRIKQKKQTQSVPIARFNAS